MNPILLISSIALVVQVVLLVTGVLLLRNKSYAYALLAFSVAFLVGIVALTIPQL